jgi:hypothetical protein
MPADRQLSIGASTMNKGRGGSNSSIEQYTFCGRRRGGGRSAQRPRPSCLRHGNTVCSSRTWVHLSFLLSQTIEFVEADSMYGMGSEMTPL